MEKNLERHPRHGGAAGRALRGRPEEGVHRGLRGQQARHPGDRHRRHQLRSRADRLRRSRATTTPSAPSGCSPRASPTPTSTAPASSEGRTSMVRAKDGGRALRPCRQGRRRRAAPARLSRRSGPSSAARPARTAGGARGKVSRHRGVDLASSFVRQQSTAYGGHASAVKRRVMAEVTAQMVKELRERTGAGMMDCKNALTETAGRHREGDRRAAQEGPRRAPPRRPAASPPRAPSAPTSTPAARSACWSRSTARPTSWPAPTSSRSWCATSRCTSPPPTRASCAARRSRRTCSSASAAIFREQALASGKPRQRGREDRRGQDGEVLRRVVLLEQPFVKDADKTVGQLDHREGRRRSARTSRCAASPASSSARASRSGRTTSPPRSWPRRARGWSRWSRARPTAGSSSSSRARR